MILSRRDFLTQSLAALGFAALPGGVRKVRPLSSLGTAGKAIKANCNIS